MMKGVEVLLEAPDSDKVNGHTVGADSFETEVKPPNAQKSDDHEAVGVSWGVMDDPSVIEYGNMFILFERSLER